MPRDTKFLGFAKLLRKEIDSAVTEIVQWARQVQLEWPPFTSVVRAIANVTTTQGVGLILAFVDKASPVPEGTDASEIITEVRWRAVNQVASVEVIAPRVAIDAS